MRIIDNFSEISKEKVKHSNEILVGCGSVMTPRGDQKIDFSLLQEEVVCLDKKNERVEG